MEEIKVALLYDDATVPVRKHDKDAGIDLFAYVEGSYGLAYPGEVTIVETGITVEIPDGYFGWITNKSSKDYLIGGGIVDSTYQGHLLVKICNVTDKPIIIEHGMAIAQLLIIPCITPKVNLVDMKDIHNSKSDRGTDGGITRQLSTKTVKVMKCTNCGWYGTDFSCDNFGNPACPNCDSGLPMVEI
jgi:dUTP pyrophosphatase